MAEPGKYNLDIYKGDTYHWQFKLWADAAKTQPVDLTNVTANAEIRPTSADPNIVYLDCQITLPNEIDMNLDSTNSRNVMMGECDLQLSGPDGIQTVLRGDVTVTDDITQSS